MEPSSVARALVAAVVIAVVLAAVSPAAAAAPDGARLAGLLIGVDGRAARGFTLHLIDDGGNDVARATTGEDGVYRFDDLPGGSYSLGIEDPTGRMAVVDAAPLRLKGRALARRDVRLAPAGPDALRAATEANPSIGMWWAGLSPAARAMSLIGVAVFVLITISAVDDGGGSTEQPGSPI